MVLNLSRSDLFEAQRLALVFRFYMTVPRGGVGHAVLRDTTERATRGQPRTESRTTFGYLRVSLRPCILFSDCECEAGDMLCCAHAWHMRNASCWQPAGHCGAGIQIPNLHPFWTHPHRLRELP